MKPNKIQWFLGLGSLATIMDQDRKHWLLKTDKTKTVQDSTTGSVFAGDIKNVGSGITMEVSKLPTEDAVVAEGTFSSENVSNILSLAKSTFPYIPKLNGLHFARLESINLMGNDNSYHNFRMVLSNCTVVYVPITSDKSSDAIYVYKWYRTSTAPKLQVLDDNNNYQDAAEIAFSDGVTNPVFYYPADEPLQPFEVTSSSNTTCETILITDPLSLGYPLVWFTCDESDTGPVLTLGNISTGATNPLSQLLEIGHVGADSDYVARIYPCTGPLTESAPTSDVGDWSIVCTGTDPFTGADSDFTIPIDTITFHSDTETDVTISVSGVGDNVITMTPNVGWTLDTVAGEYEIPLTAFISNTYSNHAPLDSVFTVQLDQSIPFETLTTDTGVAGLFLSSEKDADQLPVYPQDVNHLEGLPDWIQHPTADSTAQHAVIYAAHNTPGYAPGNQDSRQIAGLIFDPGKERDYSQAESDGTDIGRVYVLSNDPIQYQNNATADHPKPARTIARVCDIPTSIVQLAGVHGLAPTYIVDKQYVRSYASFTEDDQEQIYNGLRNKWVRPIHLNAEGQPIYQPDSDIQSNEFVFDSLDNLGLVDLAGHNDFRTIVNLNPTVGASEVSVYSIDASGSGYQINDLGVIVVGGFSFTYTVVNVDANGGVTEVSLSPNDGTINLANFDLYDMNTSQTKPYGSSPIGDSHGTGLKVVLEIANMESKRPRKTTIVDGLFALVTMGDGIWMYTYNVSSSKWVKSVQVGTSNESDTISAHGSVSVRDSYLASILPSVQEVAVAPYEDKQADMSKIRAFKTATSFTVVDDGRVPFMDYGDIVSANKIDINKFYGCFFQVPTNRLGPFTRQSKIILPDEAMNAIREKGQLRYDSYLLWRWIDLRHASISNPGWYVDYIVVYRSLNNTMSTDSASLLPENELPYQKFVNTNPQTTVVWNIPGVGPMVWVFDPAYDKYERYTFDENTRQVIIDKKDYEWSDFDTFNRIDGTSPEPVVDANGKLLWNVMTNIPFMLMSNAQSSYWPTDNSEYIYQQPDYNQIFDIDTVPSHGPFGGWRMIFPETESFTFEGDANQNVYSGVRMNILRADDLSSVTSVTDSEGYSANYKSMLIDIDPNTNKPRMRVYNPAQERFDTV